MIRRSGAHHNGASCHFLLTKFGHCRRVAATPHLGHESRGALPADARAGRQSALACTVLTEQGGRTRVLLADDQPHVRAALADLVASDDHLELSGVAADAQEAIEMCASLRPHVAVVDVKMPGGGGPAAAEGIRRVSPGTVVLALSAHDDQRSRQAMYAAGVGDYMLKGGDVDDLLAAIRAAAPNASAGNGGVDG